MRDPALRRAAIVTLVLSVISFLLLTCGRVGGTYASFLGETRNHDSTFAGGWIGAPTSVQAPTVSGADVTLSWTPGTHGPISGEQLLGADNGTSSTCPASPVYTAIGSVLAATATSGTDSTSSTTSNGHWFCYAVRSVTAASWTAQTAAPSAVRIGFFMTGIAIANGNGTVASGDRVTIAFNQQPSQPSVSRACVFAGARTILLGDTSSSCASATADSYTVGKLVSSGSSFGGNATNDYNASITRSGNTLTVQITSSVNGSGKATTVGSPSWTFTPSTSLTSATGSLPVCTSAADCLPTPSGNF